MPPSSISRYQRSHSRQATWVETGSSHLPTTGTWRAGDESPVSLSLLRVPTKLSDCVFEASAHRTSASLLWVGVLSCFSIKLKTGEKKFNNLEVLLLKTMFFSLGKVKKITFQEALFIFISFLRDVKTTSRCF